MVKQRIAALGADTWVVAKLEKPQAIDNLESILDVTDGVMVARGDLGVEMPPEKVPAIQKHVIRRAAEHRKPVITATQMLESMIENPRPTRAEASDVANAVYDGTDAVMLSAESAAGKYPIEAVKMMAKIVIETESHKPEISVHDGQPNHVRLSVAETICESMAHAAEDLDLAAIAVFTETGATARQLSKYHPKPPIYALSSIESVINRMNLLWGVHPVKCAESPHCRADGGHGGTASRRRAAMCGRRTSSELSPEHAPNPAQPTSCVCIFSATVWLRHPRPYGKEAEQISAKKKSESQAKKQSKAQAKKMPVRSKTKKR